VSRSLWFAIGLGSACWLAVLPAHASISAQIPVECGSLAEFEHELEARLGSVTDPEATRVTLTPELAGYQLVVEAAGQRRELHDSSCQELLRAAVVITLALLEPNHEEPPVPAAELVPPPKAVVKVAGSASPKIGLSADGGIHFGTLPDATLLLELETQLKWTRFGLAAGLRYLLPTQNRDDAGRGARVDAMGATVAALFEPWHGLQARLGLATYRLSATGLGSAESRDGAAWELAPTLGASFTPLESPPFWTSVGVEGQLNLIRPSFEILKYDEVFRVPTLSGSALARAGVVF